MLVTYLEMLVATAIYISIGVASLAIYFRRNDISRQSLDDTDVAAALVWILAWPCIFFWGLVRTCIVWILWAITKP